MFRDEKYQNIIKLSRFHRLLFLCRINYGVNKSKCSPSIKLFKHTLEGEINRSIAKSGWRKMTLNILLIRLYLPININNRTQCIEEYFIF